MTNNSAPASPVVPSAALPIRIGITGANAERAWALTAHLPAIRMLPHDLAITAVSARTQELADKARTVFGASQAFGDSLELVRSPEVDLVVVTVKVPEHRAIVLAALAAGKHVFCEWPLGRDEAEAEELAAAVPASSQVMIGLQGLSAPAVRRAQEMIRSGAIGTPKLIRVYSPSVSWGASVPPVYAYLQDKRNGATLETIPGGHTLALIEALAGPYAEVDARNSILRPRVRVIGTDEMVERTCADHMMVLGLHQGGCLSTLEIAGGVSDTPFALTIEGDNGWIKLIGPSRVGTPVDYQSGHLLLETSFSGTVPVNAAVPGLEGSALNMAESYARLVQDIRTGSRTVPDFAAAARLTRLIATIDRASQSGRQVIGKRAGR